MNTQDRKEILHFLYGLETYIVFKYGKDSDNYRNISHIKKWFLFQDFFSLRKLLMHEIVKGYNNDSESDLNLILHDKVEKTIKKDYLLKYVNAIIDDNYIFLLAKFFRRLPHVDLNDFLSKGQVNSKLWLITELKKIIDNKSLEIKNIAIYGCWYSFLAPLLLNEFNLESVRGFDIDPQCTSRSDLFMQDYVQSEWKYKCVTQDVNELIPLGASGKLKYYIVNDFNQKISETKKFDLIINTSAEHMKDSWLKNLRKDQLVLIQTNNMIDISKGHINCFESFDKAKDYYRSLGEIYWAGNAPLTDEYERYMFFLRRRDL